MTSNNEAHPPNAGKGYTKAEIRKIVKKALEVGREYGRKENTAPLAKELGRSETAIEWIMRWTLGGGRRFPRVAQNKVIRQIREVLIELGHDPAAFEKDES